MSAMDSTADNLKRPLDARPISPAIFAHFVVRTSNYDAMRRWYETVNPVHRLKPVAKRFRRYAAKTKCLRICQSIPTT